MRFKGGFQSACRCGFDHETGVRPVDYEVFQRQSLDIEAWHCDRSSPRAFACRSEINHNSELVTGNVHASLPAPGERLRRVTRQCQRGETDNTKQPTAFESVERSNSRSPAL